MKKEIMLFAPSIQPDKLMPLVRDDNKHMPLLLSSQPQEEEIDDVEHSELTEDVVAARCNSNNCAWIVATGTLETHDAYHRRIKDLNREQHSNNGNLQEKRRDDLARVWNVVVDCPSVPKYHFNACKFSLFRHVYKLMEEN